MPVAWVYLTGWAAGDGLIHFRDDIYGLDTPEGLVTSTIPARKPRPVQPAQGPSGAPTPPARVQPAEAPRLRRRAGPCRSRSAGEGAGRPPPSFPPVTLSSWPGFTRPSTF